MGCILGIPAIHKLFLEDIEAFYIRQVYIDLFKLACKNPHSMGFEDPIYRMTISATWRLAAAYFRFMSDRDGHYGMETTKTAILLQQGDDKCIWTSRNAKLLGNFETL